MRPQLTAEVATTIPTLQSKIWQKVRDRKANSSVDPEYLMTRIRELEEHMSALIEVIEETLSKKEEVKAATA